MKIKRYLLPVVKIHILQLFQISGQYYTNEILLFFLSFGFLFIIILF